MVRLIAKFPKINACDQLMKPNQSYVKDGYLIHDSVEVLPSTNHNIIVTGPYPPTPQEYQSLLPNIQRLAQRIADATPMYPVDAAWDDPEEWQSNAVYLAHSVLRLLARLPKSS